MSKWYKNIRRVLVLLAMGVFAFPVLAAGQMAQIGMYDADGHIKLDKERFQTSFSRGIQVSEVRLDISIGLVHLVRQGYDEENACRTERIEVLYRDGSPVVAGMAAVAGEPVFIFSTSVINIFACLDDKCNALKGVVIPGEPPLLSAACDRSELSGNKCSCHINDGTGERVTEGDFCNSAIDNMLRPTVYWVKLAYVDSH